ncbi:MAG: flippase-like domain-containing protein [Desulfobulbaceae bacterium]|nr:flippase-like domain-containing protein [Desulfobulbaceae bacterium]
MNHLFRLIVSLLLLFFIGRSVDWSAVTQAILALPSLVLVGALFLQIASACVAALRWQLVMRTLAIPASFFFYLASYFKGTFFNQGLPTSIGGDALRILDATRITTSKEKAFFGVLIDRLMGVAGLIILNFGALVLGGGILAFTAELSLGILLVLALLALVLLFFLARFSFFQRGGMLGMLGRLSQCFRQVNATPGLLLQQLGLSLLVHLLAMFAFYILASGLGLSYPFFVYLVLVPPALLLTVLPVSLAGWGVREGALVGLFVLIGAPRATVLTCSLLYGFNNLVASLPGLVVYLRQRGKL